MAKPYVSIIIPTLNEAKNLKWLLPGIKKVMKNYAYEIIIVDKNSTDGTQEVAKRFGARLISGDLQKGAALIRGFDSARGKVLISMDADLSHRPKELLLLITGIETGYDMCAGSRFITGGGSEDITFIRRIGNKFFVTLGNLLYGAKYTDICYGYNAFTRRSIRKLHLEESGFGIETDMHTKAAKYGLKIIEIPSYEKKRKYGFGKLKTVRDGFLILRIMLKNRFS
jgi:glycosyltransferase involved in cell wall biosynthesis